MKKAVFFEWLFSGMTLAGMGLLAEGFLLAGFAVSGAACALWGMFFARFNLWGLTLLEILMFIINLRGIWNL